MPRLSRYSPLRRPSSAPRLVLFLLLVLTLGVGLGLRSAPTTLASRLREVVEESSREGGFWGVFVQDAASGEVLFAHQAQNPMLPASNQKILTTAAALDALGDDFRYKTVLYFDGGVRGGTLHGDLILRGSADPTFGSIEVGGGDPLRAWARALAEMGVEKIEGRLIGDDDAVIDRPYAEGWDVDYVTQQASRALGVSASGLSYRDNVAEVRVTARGPGAPPEVNVYPDGYLTIENRLATSSRTRGIALEVRRDFGAETVTLEGSVPRTYDGTIVIPVADPTLFTLSAFRRHLQEAGITVESEVIDADALEEKPSLEEARPLFVHVSPRLAKILQIVNKESNNFYAEQVFRSITPGGSPAGAEQRIKQLLTRAGAETSRLSIRDGSGLSRKDMVTPEAMGRLLSYMHEQHPEREAFLASLAAGGESGSTLRYRLHDVSVLAKTGSLEYVRTLSGYTKGADGRTLAFVVFANNYTIPSYRVTQTIDRIVREVASDGTAN